VDAINAFLQQYAPFLVDERPLALFSVALSVFVVQVVKGYCADHWRDMKSGEIWGLSFCITLALFCVFCAVTRKPLRDPSILGLGVMASLGGPVFIWALKRYANIDINDITGGKEPPPDAGTPAGPTPPTP
jgi:hypothetical protein